MSEIGDKARAAAAKHNLLPLEMGDDHHTNAPFNEEDEEVAELAYWLGGIFIDKDTRLNPDTALYKDSYFYNEMTSHDAWRRVARALRIHGLKIVHR